MVSVKFSPLIAISHVSNLCIYIKQIIIYRNLLEFILRIDNLIKVCKARLYVYLHNSLKIIARIIFDLRSFSAAKLDFFVNTGIT